MKTHPTTPDSHCPPRTAPGARHRILVVDDHPMMRAGLVQLINSEPDLVVCAEAGTPIEALGLFTRQRPELVLADLSLPGRGGLEFIKDLHALEPQAAILVISMQDESLYAERTLRAGARGYIMKEAGAKQLLQAMRHVLAGHTYVSPVVSGRIVSSLSGDATRRSHSPIARLSDREFEIYELIGQGRDTADIARILGLSRKTVDVHRGSIKRKLGLASGTALVHHAVHRHVNGHSSGEGDQPARDSHKDFS